MHNDRLVPVRANADGREARAGEFFQGQHVVAGVLRKVLQGAGPGDVLGPTVEVLEDRHRVVELGLRHGPFVVADAVDVVGNANRDLLDAREDVQLGHEVVREAVDAGSMAGQHGVVPTATARTAGVHAELATGLLQIHAHFVEQFRGERTGANTCGVSLDDADGTGNTRGANARANGRTARRRVG